MSTTNDLISVTIADGKYTIHQLSPGCWEALRYGEPWPAYDLNGVDNLHVALAYAVHDLQAENEKLMAASEAHISEIEARLKEAEMVIGLAEEYIIDGITMAKEQYEMNAPYPTREPGYRAALDEARAAHAAVRAWMEGK